MVFWIYPQPEYQGTPMVMKDVKDDGSCMRLDPAPKAGSLSQLAGHWCYYYTGDACNGQGVTIDTRKMTYPAGSGFKDLAGFRDNIHSYGCVRVD